SINRSRQRPVVVLPLPDSPTSPNVSPSSISKLTSSTAAIVVPRRRNPPPRVNCLTRCDTSTSGIGLQRRIVQVAPRSVIGADAVIGWNRAIARVEAVAAARVERAAGRQRAEHRHGTLDGAQPPALAGARHRGEQAAGVRVLRVPEDLADAAVLDDPAAVHDR